MHWALPEHRESSDDLVFHMFSFTIFMAFSPACHIKIPFKYPNG